MQDLCTPFDCQCLRVKWRDVVIRIVVRAILVGQFLTLNNPNTVTLGEGDDSFDPEGFHAHSVWSILAVVNGCPIVWYVDSALLEKALTIIITGTTGFIGAGSKFLADLKKIEEQTVARVRRDITDPMAKSVEEIRKRLDELYANYRANVVGWKLEIESLKGDIEDLQSNRRHGYQSAVDYHNSDELIRRIEMLETDVQRMQTTLNRMEATAIDEDTFQDFVTTQNQKALEVARLLGQIEGELKARFKR